MYYFIKYDSKTGDVLGLVKSSTKDITPNPRFEGEATVEVTSEEMTGKLQAFDPLSARLSGRVHGNKVQTLSVAPRFRGRIVLEANQPDRDGDGKPEVAADGSSAVDITALLVDRDGQPATKESVPIRFAVTRGSLAARDVSSRNGQARISWRSPAETVVARISATAEGFEQAALVVEFIPPDEYTALSSSQKK